MYINFKTSLFLEMFYIYAIFIIFKYAFVPVDVDIVAVTFELRLNPISSFADKLIIILPLNSSSVFADISLIILELFIGLVFCETDNVKVASVLGEPLKK